MGQFAGVELDGLVLTGPRLTLRPWRADDAAAVHQIMQDRRMHEFLALPDPYTPEAATSFVTTVGDEGRADGTGVGCAVVSTDSGHVVGAAALRLQADPEIGYWIAPAAWGNGYAAEATRVLAEWAFRVGVQRVRLACEVRNLASARTALRAGFRYEGTSRNGLVGGGAGGIPERRGDLARFARIASDSGQAVAHAFPPFPVDGVSDGVVRLRVMQSADATGVLECDDAEAVRWSFSGTAVTPAEAATEAATAGLHWLVGGQGRLAIVDVGTGRFAGSVTVRKAGPPQIGGIGYVVHPTFRGRGYTSRALRLLARWAFDAADFARLELGAKVDNVASLRAAASAGFQPDGVRKRRLRNPDGSFSDEGRYALINPRYA